MSEAKETAVERDESESLAKLTEALAKAQGAFKAAPKDSKNSFYDSKYADLATVMSVVREPLSANGLAISQRLTNGSGGVIITTMLLHSSGEWMRDRILVPVEPNVSRDGKKQPWIQAFGSAVTYARRYSLMAMLGVAAEGEDDDGEAAAQGARGSHRQERQERQQQPSKSQPPPAENLSGRVRTGKRKGVLLSEVDDTTLGEIERWCATNDKPEAREMFADIAVEWKRRGGPKAVAAQANGSATATQ